MLIKDGLVFDAVHETPCRADIRTEGAVIREIAHSLSPAPGEDRVDEEGALIQEVDQDQHRGHNLYDIF